MQLWLSVDPLAEKFPNASPYNYCLGNPINLVDPDGREPVLPSYSWGGWSRGFVLNPIKASQWYGVIGRYDGKTFVLIDL